MAALEDLKANATIRGVLPTSAVTVVNVQWFELRRSNSPTRTQAARWRTNCSTATPKHAWT